jgi:DegV family protein with EDD domain
MATSRVTVVTDSTAYLPPTVAEAAHLTVVPLQVVIDGRSLAEGTEVSSAEVAEALRAGRSVTTSGPPPAAFEQVYREIAARRPGDSIVSVHLSGALSATVDAARVAARQLAGDEGVAVEVVDSRNLALGLGFAALAAARAAERGEPGPDVARAAERCAHDSSTWVYVDTLEYLRRGGRLGPAAAAFGTVLSVKPLLHLVDGRLEVLDRVRTASRALARLERAVVDGVGTASVDVGVQHLAAPGPARELAERLRVRLPGVRRLYTSEVGAVVGTHVGPGMVGVAVAPA